MGEIPGGEVELLGYALGELTAAVVALDDSQMDIVSNCAPWTVRQLASHAMNNQLLWAGMVTGEDTVSPEVAMGAVAYEGDLSAIAEDSARRAFEMWGRDGVLEGIHATPLGELPGVIVINFPTIDALAHAWDLSASVGNALEFKSEQIPAASAVVDLTCTEHAVEIGLIKPPAEPPADATDTERLMAAAGRSIPR